MTDCCDHAPLPYVTLAALPSLAAGDTAGDYELETQVPRRLSYGTTERALCSAGDPASYYHAVIAPGLIDKRRNMVYTVPGRKGM